MIRFRPLGLRPKTITALEDIILVRNVKHVNTRNYQSASSSAVESPSQWFGKPSQSIEHQRILEASEMQRLLADEISDALDDAVDLETHESISNSIHQRDSEFEGHLWNLSLKEIKPKSTGQKMTLDSMIPNDYRFDPDLNPESMPQPLPSISSFDETVLKPVINFEDKIYQRFSPLANNQRTTIVSLDFLAGLLAKKDLNGVRKELSENLWPLLTSASKEVIQETFRTFILSSKSAEDVDEILFMISDLTKQQPSAFLNQKLLFEFIQKTCEIPKPEKPIEGQIYGPKKVVEVINQIKNLFPPGARHFSRSQLLSLYESLFNHSDTDFISASKVCNALISIDLVPDRKVFLEVAAKYLLTKLPYDDAFYKWSSSCSIDNIVSGGDIFLEHVLSDKKMHIKFQQKRIRQLVKFYERILSPSDVIAQLIVSLCSTGRSESAKALWMNVDIDCKYFLAPVYKLRNNKFVDVNLIHIRDFAHLLEECVLAELKQKKKTRKKKKAGDSEEKKTSEAKVETIPGGDMEFLLKEWQPFKKRNKYIKQKIKKFDVKADQMEALLNAIQEVWVWLIELKNDPTVAGPGEIEKFLAKNHIPLAEKLHKRVQRLKEIQKNRGS